MIEQEKLWNRLVRYAGVAWLNVCLAVAAGCSPDLRSTEFACAEQSDCESMGRVCQAGWCVLAGSPTQDGGAGGGDAQTCAPPTVDGQETSTLAGNNLWNWSHVVGEGDDRLLVIGISFSSTAIGASIQSVQADGADLTLMQGNGLVSIVRSEIWALSDPPAGARNIQVAFTENVSAVGGSLSLFGVDPASAIVTAVGASGTTGDPAVTLSASPGALAFGCASAVNSAGGLNAGSGQSELWNDLVDDGALTLRGAGGVAPGAASVTMEWSVTGNAAWAVTAVSVRACP